MTIDIEKLSADVNIPTEKLKQFAEAYAAKVLEDKEREIAELGNSLQKILEVLAAGADLNESYRKTIDWYDKAYDAALEEKTQARHDEEVAYKHYHELQSHINDLRDALEEISNWKFGWDGDCGVTAVAEQALTKTPAQSLQNITALKADARRWQYFRETASEEMCYELCGNSNPENEELNQAIDKRMNVTEND